MAGNRLCDNTGRRARKRVCVVPVREALVAVATVGRCPEQTCPWLP